jgi:hypothetical protein
VAVKRDERGEHVIPQVKLGGTTVVHDKARNQKVMELDGVVVLPVGSTIELPDSQDSAEVIGVRLLSPVDDYPAHVCLDVKVPREYWGEPPVPFHAGTSAKGRR